METTSRPILIADDEIHIVTMLKRRLVSLGYEVLVARSGDEALEMAKASSPFFAVIDFQMPGLNGV
ncbi:MAG: response regulator, partial [Planctomycetota bacterium]